jgi:hypothetical protein
MQEYCAYIVGPDGQIVTRTDLGRADEDEAKDCAVRLIDGQNMELWQPERGAMAKRRH